MSSLVAQITPNIQKETQPPATAGVRVEKFSGNIEVVYPPGWNTSPQATTIPNASTDPAVPQTPEEHSLKQLRETIDGTAATRNLPTATREMDEAILRKAA